MIVELPRRYGPERPPRKRLRKNRATIVHLHQPVDAETLYLRGGDLDDTNPELAERLYLECIRLEPGHDRAMTNLANVYHRTGRRTLARITYRRALDINPEQPEALYNLGYMHADERDPDTAIPLLRRAIGADPSFADAHFNLGVALEDREPRTAAHHFRRYLELAANDRWADLARSYLARLRAV